ncbi:MAG: PTS fructose transporter subunit IIA [Elusimicrobia bacterium]|nr:PTS fructose transporter subunit IIA [Elusimicrobiota bacterium]
MINFVIVTHGEFGAYLVEAAEQIVGHQERGVRVVPVSSRATVAEMQERIARAIAELSEEDGLVVLTDMPGGTPGNIAFPLIKDLPRVEMVSGVNLYMLVAAFSHRQALPLDRLVEKIMEAGQKSIRDIRYMFLSKAVRR